MDPVTLSDSAAILNLLNGVALRGKGFRTECLLDDVLDAGFTAPDHLSAYGEDPEAYYQGKSPAWAVYHIRQWKRVMMVYGGTNQERRFQITETP
jgi:hypothetical protein